MIAEEGGGTFFIDFAGGHHGHKLDDIFLGRLKAQSIEIEEEVGCRETRSFVAINEGMIFHNPIQIRCSKVEKVGLAIGVLVQRPAECGFECSFIAQTNSASMEAQLFLVESFDKLPAMEVDHLARAR